MGNSASSSARQHDDTVDYGYLVPQGIYSGPHDWNQQIVAQLIIERRLAPFYRPLEDYEDNWDDEQILAARKELPDQEIATSESSSRIENTGHTSRSASISSTANANLKARQNSLKEPSRIPEAMVYRGAVECPICFLYYPPNINYSRCCEQAICTECFVQIKRAEPTTTHLVSEPAACPYCVQDNFGVVYTPPQWRAGIGADNQSTPIHLASTRSTPPSAASARPKDKHRRKSFGADSAEVVTIDHIRPDWEAKLEAVRATATRRANRRIIMRQVGDRLIPVGVTSGRVHPLAGEVHLGEIGDNANENEGRGSRRSRRRQHQQQPQDLNQLLGTMGLGGQDLEELMIMEAMRLSLIEQEEQQRKEADKKRKEEAERAAKNGDGSQVGNGSAESATGSSSSASRLELPPIPSTSPIEVIRPNNRNFSPSFGSSPGSRGSPSSIPNASTSPNTNNASVLSTSASRSHAPAVSSPLGAAAPSTAGRLSVTPIETNLTAHSRSSSQTHSTSPASTPQPTAQFARHSTLSAALAGHGVASAILSASDRGASAPVPSSSSAVVVTPATISSLAPDFQESPAPPPPPPKEPLKIQASPEPTTPTPGSSRNNLPAVPEAESTLAPEASEDDLSVSQEPTGASYSSSYDELPSSPESTLSHRPLLMETPSAESEGVNELSGPKHPTSERADSVISL